MDHQSLNELLTRQPFAPFGLKLSDQETVDVVNPALVVLMKRDIFIADPSGDRFRPYALLQVLGVESLHAA